MKKFIFNNGKTTLESQIPDGRTFEQACIRWSCFDKITKQPLPYTIQEATEEDLQAEEERLAKNRKEYEDACEQNEEIHEYNCRITHPKFGIKNW